MLETHLALLGLKQVHQAPHDRKRLLLGPQEELAYILHQSIGQLALRLLLREDFDSLGVYRLAAGLEVQQDGGEKFLDGCFGVEIAYVYE